MKSKETRIGIVTLDLPSDILEFKGKITQEDIDLIVGSELEQ